MNPVPNATVTRCCTSTSSGFAGASRGSMRPAATASRAAAASMSSSAWVGTSVTREGRPGEWPERPARCTSRATPLALPTCSTRSTGEKSTPRSRLDVQTTALSRPALSPVSTHSRTERSSEPWCSASRPAQSGRASSSAWYQSSACERVLVKTSVLALASSSAITGASIRMPRWPPHGNRSVDGGSSASTTSDLGTCPRTSRPRSCATSACIAASRLPSVADNPQTRSAGLKRASRASASCTCTPRLLPSSSCHSSMTTRATRPSAWGLSARDSMSDRLSGVVTSASGSRRSCRARTDEDVSPVRRPTAQSSPNSASGAASAWAVSEASARIGVIHSTFRPACDQVWSVACSAAPSAPNHTA